MSGQASRRGGQWPVALLNGGVGLAVLILVAVLALVVNPPAPPGIAAFAPQANKPIIKAPQNQSASTGEGDGACAAGQACAAVPTTTTSTTIKGKPRGVPSGLQCYFWPDGSVTQTFDPQSPPCIATWDDTKGNGGATSPGVTASEVRVALPVTNATNTHWPGLKPIVDFFNTRFQLYGRRITIVPVPSQQAVAQSTGDYNNPGMQRADASQIASMKVFATHDFVDPIHYTWSLPVFRDVLSRAKIVSIHGGETTPNGSAADLAAKAPYEWTYYPPVETVMRNFGTMACRQLVGKPATHAGDNVRSLPRKFAALLPVDGALGGPMPGLETLQQVLAGCGVSLRIERFNGAERSSTTTTTATLTDMRRDGITSVFWFPDHGGGTPTHPWSLAQSIGYQPEWLMIGSNKYQSDFEIQNPKSQTEHAFGVGVWNKMPQLELEIWHRAYQAAGGTEPGVLSNGRAFYQEMLLLASGIQMAGPNLTPESFARGLQATRFANPGAGGPPYFQGSVGFGEADTVMVNDLNAFWLDPNYLGRQLITDATTALNTYRTNCYVGLGRRFSLDTWPTSDGYYANGVCR